MNLNNSPTPNELRSLLASCVDATTEHVLWVNKAGDVFISPIPDNMTPIGFEESKSDMRLRYETFGRGNSYTGLEASGDSYYVQRLYESLMREWNSALKSSSTDVEFIDLF